MVSNQSNLNKLTPMTYPLTEVLYQSYIQPQKDEALRATAQFYLNHLYTDSPSRTRSNLLLLMLTRYEIFTRSAENEDLDLVAQDTFVDAALTYQGVFQVTREKTIAALLDFCDTQIATAEFHDDNRSWCKWERLKASLSRGPTS